jgi:hypothetical protein
MKTILILTLVGAGGLVLWKRQVHAAALKHTRSTEEANLAPAGVNEYDDTAAAQRPAQIYAAYSDNPDSVSEPGFAPAFGPDENQ